MLKIIIIIIGYILNNFPTHITVLVDDGKMYNFKILKQIHFLKFLFFVLSMWKLTLGYIIYIN